MTYNWLRYLLTYRQRQRVSIACRTLVGENSQAADHVLIYNFQLQMEYLSGH